MPGWAATLIAAAITLTISFLVYAYKAGILTGTIKAEMTAVRSDVAVVRSEFNSRLDKMEKSQERQWETIDQHTEKIGELRGKIEVLQEKRASGGKS